MKRCRLIPSNINFHLSAITVLFLILGLCSGARDANNDEESKFKFPGSKDYPALPPSGRKPADFVSKQWSIIAKAQGDLNNDGIADLALAVQAAYPRFLQKNTNLGSDPFDTNPRRLIVLFRSADGGYRLAACNNFVLGMPEFPTIEPPFQSLAIKGGAVVIEDQIFMSAGSWSVTSYAYRFRYNGSKFEMIGADVTDSSRASGESNGKSFNFLTHKKKITTSSMEGGTTKVRWAKVAANKKILLDDFKHLNDWQNILEHY